jgi:hypothetical protein
MRIKYLCVRFEALISVEAGVPKADETASSKDLEEFLRPRAQYLFNGFMVSHFLHQIIKRTAGVVNKFMHVYVQANLLDLAEVGG